MASKHKHMAPHGKSGGHRGNHAHAATVKLGGGMPGVMHKAGHKHHGGSHASHHAEHCKPAHMRRGK